MTGEAPRAEPRVNGRVQYGLALGWGRTICNNLQLGFYQRLATLVLLVYALVIASDSMGDRLRGRRAGGLR
ncbi:MAG: hypothetical protein HY237_03790 [Acidobacteria bacterium]|nr:hypothetical protein [Acidobacteriota bacterium]